MRALLVLAIIASVGGCTGLETAQTTRPLVNDIVINDLTDECALDWTDCSVVDGDCSWREAVATANNSFAGMPGMPGRTQPFDACTPGLVEASTGGMPTNIDRLLFPEGIVEYAPQPAGYDATANGAWILRAGSLKIRSSIAVVGAGVGPTVFDPNDMDRGIYTSWGGKIWVEYENIVIDDATANGDGLSTINGIANGGGIYHNAPGTLRASGLRITNSRSLRGASAIAFCTDPPAGYNPAVSGPWTDFQMTNVEIDHNSGAAPVFTHVDVQWYGLDVHDNVTDQLSGNAAGYITTHRTVTCTDCLFTTNSAPNGSGVIVVLGSPQLGGTQGASTFRLVGGAIVNNSTGANGAVAVNGGQGGTDLLGTGQWCGGTGCRAELVDVLISGNTADAAPGGLNGSGGGLYVNGTGALPGRIELRGATTVSNNADGSMAPAYGPDCFTTGAARIALYDSASVANLTGCAIDDFRSACGDGLRAPGEECDDGNSDNGDCCSAICTYEPNGSTCEADACTVGDACDGAGTCLPGSSSCGDGVLQSACGEACDLGANNGVMSGSAPCRLDCSLAMCEVWE